MARALILACGCRGRELGRTLAAEGWRIRGTTRDATAMPAIADAGIEPVLADPDEAGTVLDHIGDVTVLFWLLGCAEGSRKAVAAIQGPRLERVMERIVDSPVRGFVYEAAGTAPADQLAHGAAIVTSMAERHRIPVEIVAHDPSDWRGWTTAMSSAARRLAGPRPNQSP